MSVQFVCSLTPKPLLGYCPSLIYSNNLDIDRQGQNYRSFEVSSGSINGCKEWFSFIIVEEIDRMYRLERRTIAQYDIKKR